jgi:hypothetical protein
MNHFPSAAFKLFSVFDFCQFNCNIDLSDSPKGLWGLMNLNFYVPLQIREVFSHYFFESSFCPFLFLFMFLGFHYVYIISHNGIAQVLKALFTLFFLFGSIDLSSSLQFSLLLNHICC